MQKKALNRYINLYESILNALRIMDQQHVKLLLVFNKDQFINIITIGDIQRAIICNKNISDPISTILEKDKIFAKDSDTKEDIKQLMLDMRAECMPVLDDNGRLIKTYFWEDMFSVSQTEQRPLINIPVIFMAGGKGTRLLPLTNIIPKPLLPIGEKTITEIILNQFEKIGCSKFYLSINYKSELIKYYFNNLEHKYDISYIQEQKPLGTIGSISLLDGEIKSPFFVSNCDIIIDQDYRDVYDYHINNKNDITIVSSLKTYSIPYGVMQSGNDGLLQSIQEKPSKTVMINTGVYILQPDLIDLIPKNKFFHITDLMEIVQKKGGRIGCFPISEDSWVDIGDWDKYLKKIKK